MKGKTLLMMSAVWIGTSCGPEPADMSSVRENQSECVPLTVEEIQTGRMTPEILWKLGRIGEFSVSPDGETVLYAVTCYQLEENKGTSAIWAIPSEGGSAVCLNSGNVSNPRWKPSGKAIGYISEGQIWEMAPDGTDRVQISDIPGGVNGFEYAPAGEKLYYLKDVKMDQDLHDVYPDLPKSEAISAESLDYRHWDQWHDYSYSHLFISEIHPGEKIVQGKDIMEGEAFDSPLAPYFESSEIAWSPDGQSIAYTCKKLKGTEAMLSTNSDIYLYSLPDGSTKNLTEGMPGYDRNPSFSPDGSKIAFQSMATAGYESDKERLMVTDLASGSMTDLSVDFDQSSVGIVWDPSGKALYFTSVIQGTIQVYKAEPDSGKISPLTSGVHDYTGLSMSGQTLVGKKESMSGAAELYVLNAQTGEERPLTQVNQNIYKHIASGKVESRWITSTDGAKILTWVVYPPDFDPAKKYPALLFCEGGPQNAVSQFFSYRWNFQLMAAKGYIVVAPNRRGLPGFGQAWTDQIAGDYGGQNMDDYLSTMDAIAREPYVDAQRLGAVGASYGAYSVFWLAGHHQKRFKAFIAHCGMFNLESQYGSTEEYWFVNHDLEGPYWNDPKPKSYDFSPHRYVQYWDTPILIIHGGRDFRIPYTESMQAFNAAQLRGIPSKFLFFPEESHWVTRPQNSILWQREFFGWLDRWLK
ncbi:MAG: S9 family peptidase [Bacteroidales bacterium]|nr:S9 family peptidase [Bacteroidales bacterium]